MKTRTVAALSALVAATALAATAGFAAVSAAPDPAKMVLQAADIPNAKVKGKRLKPGNGYVAVYARDFELSKPYGSSQLVFISSEVALAATAKTTVTEIAGIRKFLRSSQGRQFLASTFAAELGTAVTKKDVTIGNLRTPSIGDEAVLVSLTVRTKQGRFYAAFTWFRVDRALSTISVFGLRPAGPVSVAKLGGMVVAHVGQQFTPASTVPPTIAGTVQQGRRAARSTLSGRSPMRGSAVTPPARRAPTSWVRPHRPISSQRRTSPPRCVSRSRRPTVSARRRTNRFKPPSLLSLSATFSIPSKMWGRRKADGLIA